MRCRFRMSSSIVFSMSALSSSPSACMPPVPSSTRSEPPSASSSSVVARVVADLERRLPRRSRGYSRLCPAFAAAPVRPVRTESVPSSGPSRYVPALNRHAQILYCRASARSTHLDQGRAHMAVELDHPFTTARPIDDSFATILDLERVVPCVEGGSVLERTGPDVGQGRDQGEDGRDVDDVHRHRRGRSSRTPTAHRSC